jgi:leucyl-tRNA synthetase
LLKVREPFKRLLTQGMVIKDGAKMSKSKGNVVDPDQIVDKYGADTARLFMLFASPPDKDLDWSDKGVEGCFRFIGRVWRLVNRYGELYTSAIDFDGIELDKSLRELRSDLHRTVKIVTNDIEERMQYNTAIARMMELVNSIYQIEDVDLRTPEGGMVISEVFSKLLPMLSPFIPHVSEEMWEIVGNDTMLVFQSWPEYSDELAQRDEIEIVFQVNGKIRSRKTVSVDIAKEDMEEIALGDERIRGYTQGKKIVKVVVVPGKLVNVVVK